MDFWLEKAVQFLRSAGLHVSFQVGARGFIEGVRICQGGLLVDPGCRVSALLHEAAHLGVVPAQYRHLLSDDIDTGVREMLRHLRALDLFPDDPLERAVLHCSDPEATALAWAYGVHLGIPGELVIMDDEYDGSGAEIRFLLEAKAYIGINGLQHAGGFTRASDRYTWLDVPTYPALAQWLQAVVEPAGGAA